MSVARQKFPRDKVLLLTYHQRGLKVFSTSQLFYHSILPELRQFMNLAQISVIIFIKKEKEL
jgi:hypothetical protein